MSCEDLAAAPSFDAFKASVMDADRPLAERTRAVFFLKQNGTREAAVVLEEALKDKSGTALYRHELAYVLGQMGQEASIVTLVDIIRDTADDVVVRHECCEALGAISKAASKPILEEFLTDDSVEIRETCELALARLNWAESTSAEDEARLDPNPYMSVDPAPAAEKSKSTEELRRQLLDTSLPLFDRYRAMFSLRNRGGTEAVEALVAGFADDSALFRHEVAYVLGQMQDPAAKEGLSKVLLDTKEHGMVRHEAAEALGAVGGEDSVKLLETFKADPAVIVRESCEVALDIADYWAPSSTDEATTADATTATATATAAE